MKPEGVFFDLYGTLLMPGDQEAAWSDWLLTFHRSISELGVSVTREALKRACDGLFSRPAPSCGGDGLTIFERRLLDVCRELSGEFAEDDARTVAYDCVSAWQRHVLLDPQAVPVLEKLGTGRKLALISNFDHPPHVHALLSDMGLRAFFDAVVISGEVGVKKPDPGIFHIALGRTGLRPDKVVYVGDSAEDVEGALATSLTPILIRRGDGESDAMISDFRATGRREEGLSITTKYRGVLTIRQLTSLLDLIGD